MHEVPHGAVVDPEPASGEAISKALKRHIPASPDLPQNPVAMFAYNLARPMASNLAGLHAPRRLMPQ